MYDASLQEFGIHIRGQQIQDSDSRPVLEDKNRQDGRDEQRLGPYGSQNKVAEEKPSDQ
jgi:hypothetical protein